MNSYLLTLNFITPDYMSEEYSAPFLSLEEALEEADEIAFRTVGFPIEDWKALDFGNGNRLYSFCPNEEDKSSRYKLSIVEDV